MKNKILAAAAAAALAAVIFVAAAGFIQRSDVALTGYQVSEDGRSLTIQVGVTSSAGYIRSCTAKSQGENLYLSFYSTFGGFNSSLGAKSEFTVELEPECRTVFFSCDNLGSSSTWSVLHKDAATGQWLPDN